MTTRNHSQFQVSPSSVDFVIGSHGKHSVITISPSLLESETHQAKNGSGDMNVMKFAL